MTFTLIIMDSLYIMRNLLMIFFLMVVFWTNLGNCEGELTTEISTIPNGTTTTPPASSCDEPAPPDYLVSRSPDFAEGEMYANGTEIMYDCPHGYDLNGNTTAVCLYGVWTYEDAFCTASSCDEPAPPDDLVFHSPDFAEGKMYAHATEIMYDCPDGYNLNGHMTAVCLYGVWTYEDAYCTASPCDEPATPDDFVFHSPNFAKGEMYPNGTEIMYDCPDGLDLNGHMTAVCLYGVWTYEDAICTGIDSCDKYTQCFYNETGIHSTVSCNIGTPRGNTAPPCYGDGSTITCSCKSENYQLSSPDNSYLCRPDKWEDGLHDLHCLTASSCDEPAPPDYLVSHSPDFAEGEKYASGTEIMYDCPDGYDLNGNTATVCIYGVWTYEDAYCTASSCDKPAPPDNLVFHSPDFAGEMYPHGTKIMYGCPDRMALNGNMFSVCLYGVWTYENANCTGSCDKPTQCFHYGARMHTSVSCINETADNSAHPCHDHNTSITCSCNSENHQLSSTKNSYQCGTGKWVDEPYGLHCSKSSCDKYTQCHYNETRMHPTVSCINETTGNSAHPCHDHNTNITCSCKSENYQLSSPKNSYQCETGKWVDEPYGLHCSKSSCDKYTQCFHYVAWMHSTVSCDIGITDNSVHPCYGENTNITCSCKSENYQLSSPKNSYLCKTGKWEDGLYDLYCFASPCDEPAPPDDFVFHSPDFAEGEMYANGTGIMYGCPDGLDLNGHMTAVCLYGVWTYEDAYCTALPCDKPAPPDDFVFHSPDFAEGEMYAHGTEIMYGCPDGLDLNGHMTAVCLYGVWTYEDAYCTGRCDKYTQCPYDERRMHSAVICNSKPAGNTAPPCYGDGSNITCSCKSENYQLSSPNNSYLCRPDKWEDGLYDLYCLPSPCDEPAPPDDLVSHSPDFAEGEKYANGTEIMYDCPDGILLKGHITAVCLYGVWTYEVACKRDWSLILLLLSIAIFTLLFAVLLIWLVKKHCHRRGTKWIPSVEGVANEQVPPTANDESKFVSKVTFEMKDPNAYQNDVNKEENDVTDHLGDNSPGDSPNNDPEEETV